MKTYNKNIPKPGSIYDVPKYLKEDSLLPIYFLYGEDAGTIDNAIKAIEKAVMPRIGSDFNKEVVYSDSKLKMPEVIDMANSYPFGGEKKLVIVKNYENIKEKAGKSKDKKKDDFIEYIQNPADFTVLIIRHLKKLTKDELSKDPIKTLIEKKYAFEAGYLTPDALKNFIIRYAKSLDLYISDTNAEILLDLTGEEKNLLEMQINKFAESAGKGGEITEELIRNLSIDTKVYTVFQFQDAITRGDKETSIRILFNLLDNGSEFSAITGMLNKFFITKAAMYELQKGKSDDVAVRLGYNPYYLKKVKDVQLFRDIDKLRDILSALLETDVKIKTTSEDPKTLGVMLIQKILD